MQPISLISSPRRRRVVAGVLAAALAAAFVPAVSATAETNPCTTGGNPIVCENSKPGSPPSVWDISGAGDASIQGFATDISVDGGSRVDFKIDTDARAYTIDVYRTGWYQGLGARFITAVTPSAALPQRQPQCVSDLTTELYDCGNWAVSASWNVPTDAVSGVYVALLTRADTGGQSHITFVVRDDDSHADIVFQTADPTWHAYNTYGGSDFYQGAANGRSYKVSYNRPFATRGHAGGRDFYFSSEYAAVRFLEQNGYDVAYQAGVDTDRYGALLLNHDVFLSVGHDEYWSGAQRKNVEAARDAGVNLAFLAGNEVYWRTRWESSVAGTPTSYRTLVSYKETWSNSKIDPAAEWTGTWRDPRYASTANGAGLTENGLTGTAYMVNFSDLPVTVSAEEGKLRLWRQTSLQNLAAGQSQALAAHTVGYESNEDLDNGHRPAGLIRLSTTTGAVPEYLQDFGNTVAPGSTTHHTTMYRAASGALVFSSASVQWAWGLDQEHDGDGAPADPRMRQATANFLADMRAQPVTPAAGIVVTPASTDVTGPTVQISAPAAGADLANGSLVTVSGTATDSGGRVAGVEVSLDGGASWHPAQGRASWSYSGYLPGSGPVELKARAVDDSANIGPALARSVDVACPCTVHGDEVPATPSVSDTGAVELGLRFLPTRTGFITGVRFYKGTANKGTHKGTLWGSDGQMLAQAQFVDETASGWQTVRFTTPVPVAAGEAYVASYTAPLGRYAVLENAFTARGRNVDPLQVQGGFGATPAGVFGTPGTFPASSFGNADYYVDPVFSDTDNSPLTVFGARPLGGSVSVPLDTTVSARLSKPVVASSVAVALRDEAGNAVAGTTSYDAVTRTVTFVPAAPLAGFAGHTVTVSATGTDGLPVSAGGTWSFRTLRPPSASCPCGLFDETVTPQTVDVPDPDAVTLGVRFSAARAGKVTGAQFYKGPSGSGPYTAWLWGPDGQVLAQGQVTAPVTQGWQEVPFTAPVELQAGATYTIGYRAPSGRYSITNSGLAVPMTVGDLSTPANAGVFTYGGGRPTTTTSTSYLVDVVYDPTPAGPSIVSRSPVPGAAEVPVGSPVSVTVSEPLAPGASLTLTDGAGAGVAGTVAVSQDRMTVTFDPTADLAPGAVHSAAFSGQTADDGAAIGPVTWTFTTQPAAGSCPCTLFGAQVPAIQSADDGASVELGTRFSADHNGFVSAVRFYRGAGNTGPYKVTLWSAAGAALATATAPAAAEEGWQTVPLAEPYPVTAGTTYTVSYLAPTGHYAVTTGYFDQARTNGPLTAPAGAGVYVYGGGGFPQYTWQGSAYWVDPVFTSGQLGVLSTSPAAGASGVDPATTVTARLSFSPLGVDPVLSVTGPAGAVQGTSTFDPGTRTVTFTPGGPLPSGSLLTARVDAGSDTIATWSFSTRIAMPTGSVSLWAESDTPAVASWADPDAVQVGTRVRVGAAGAVHGIKYYKGSQNTGTHTGYLWSAGGQLLASGTFTGESSSGWQTLIFDQPVTVAAGTDLVVSYYAPAGHYAVTVDALATSRVQGPLSTLVPGGAYVYGTGFPSGTSSHNFWVDLLFVPAGS